MDVDIVATLHEVFPDLGDAVIEEVADMIRVQTYPPDTLICKEGAYENEFYLIVDGEVAITKRLTDDQERVLRYSVAGDFFGEMGLIQNAPRSANVRTTKETTVLEFDREVFEHLMALSPVLAWKLVRTTFDRLRANDQMALADLRKAYENLTRLDKAKLDFIQIAAHELRTPLTVIQGYADVLRHNETLQSDPGLAEVVEGIIRGTARLHEIVNGMLDISRIDTETLQVSRVPVLLSGIFADLKTEFWADIQARNLNFEIKQIGDVPYIEADPNLMHKIFYQLISNAIKYTPDGGAVTITYWQTNVEGMGPAVAVEVRDTGIGIDPQHHELIFEKFYQIGEVALHSSGKTSFKGGGPGLGLALVKGAVEAHGGMVWVESEGCDEEKCPGSAFKVLLPLRAPETDDAPQTKETD